MRFSIESLLRSKGYNKPGTRLKKIGFSNNVAYAMLNNEQEQIWLYMLWHICLLENCTPNDLFSVVLGKEDLPLPPGHALEKLVANHLPDITAKLRKYSPEKIREIAKLIADKEGQESGG